MKMESLRVSQLKAMHDLITMANDENIYGTWVTIGIPDEPMQEDFEDIAANNAEYNEIVDLFIKLVGKKGFRV